MRGGPRAERTTPASPFDESVPAAPVPRGKLPGMPDDPLRPRDALWQGAVAVSPLFLGVAPFGVVWGAAAADAGYGLAEASGFSVGVFAGAAQLAALDLLRRDAAVAVAILTALVINLRMLMYAASLAPHFAGEPRGRRLFASYLLTDQAYAIAIARFNDEPDYRWRWHYYLGAGLGLWVTWQTSTVVGALVGDTVPDAVPLGFAVPITFLAILVPSITDRSTLVAAVVAGAVATLAAPLPANAGMMIGALSGILVGFLHATRQHP